MARDFYLQRKQRLKKCYPLSTSRLFNFIVEEALASGIEEILIITGRHKRPIEDHFDSNVELEENLSAKERWELLELVK